MRNVAQDLNEHAAERRGEHGPKHRVARGAKHDLDALRHHLLHEHAVDTRLRCVRPRRLEDAEERRLHRIVAAEAKADAARLGLVRNVGGLHLQRHLAAEGARRGDRLRSGASQRLARDRQAVGGQDRLALGFGQRSAALAKRRAGRRGIDPRRTERRLAAAGPEIRRSQRRG